MKILHLSDIHMSEKENPDHFSEKVISALRDFDQDGGLSPDVMIVTGDFTNTGDMVEFDNAEKELAYIKRAFPSIKECILVPGNHDYSWTVNGVPSREDQKKVSYNHFITSCVSEGICKKHAEDVPVDIKQELDTFQIMDTFIKAENFALLIIGMNSVVLDSRDRAGQGFFSKKQHTACQRLIKHYKNLCEAKGLPLLIMAAFHHHILPVSSVERDTLSEPDKFSLTLDARRTLNFFTDNHVELAVHGHQHQPSLVRWKDEMGKSENSIYVISAGSMTQNKEDLGDVARNSFMLYDVDAERIKIYCFQNMISDWDVMEASHDPYILHLKDPLKDIKCQVAVNANPPETTIIDIPDTTKDTSDLFYLFLNVQDCEQARVRILQYYEKNKGNFDDVSLCGIHHLYGKFDVLLKFRATNGDKFSDGLKEDLQRQNIMLRTALSYFMNVSYENKKLSGVSIHKIPLIISPEAYLNSTWNMATLAVYLHSYMTTEQFLRRLNEKINTFNFEYNTRIEDIIRNYAIGQDQTVIFELFISCYQFPMLTRFTNLIEEIIRDYGIDKSTHIIYYYDERRI